jgi:hypothetical protein
MSSTSGYLCLDWVWGNADDEFEPVAGLGYWEVYAITEALKPYIKDRRSKLSYFVAKKEENRGTEVLRDAVTSSETALDVFTIALNKMRDAYKESNDANSTTNN